MCVDLKKEEKHGIRLMLPPWPTTTNTTNASASHVLPIVPVLHYLPQKNLDKEGRETIIQQVNTCSKVLQASSAPPPQAVEMDLKHYHDCNIDDTVNSTRYLPSIPQNQTGNEAQQSVRKTNDWRHDITAKSPTDFDVKWKKDAVEEQQEGDFLIRHEEHKIVEELNREREKEERSFSPFSIHKTVSTTLEFEQNEGSKSKNNHDNETNKSKNGLPTTTEELEEEGKRIEVYSRSEAFLSDTSCSLSSSLSSSQCFNRSNSIPYLNDIRHSPYIENQEHVTNGNDNNNNYDNNNSSVKSIYGVVSSGHIKDNNDDNFESVKHDNLSNVESGENIIPSRRNLIVNTESIKPCNLGLRYPPSSSYHIRDNKFSIEENVVFEEEKNSKTNENNQDKNVSHGGKRKRSDGRKSWCNAANVKSNCYSPHNYHPDQNSILSVDKRCDTRKPTYHDFVALKSFHGKHDKGSDEILEGFVTDYNLDDDNSTAFISNDFRSNSHLKGVKRENLDREILCNFHKTNNNTFIQSSHNIFHPHPSSTTNVAPDLDEKEILLRRPKNDSLLKTETRRPVSLIEERVEDFHIIHKAGSCEILSSSIPHISVPLPFDTILTRPTSPSKTFEFSSNSEGKSETKEYNNNNNNILKEEHFNPNNCYTSEKRRICYRSSIRIMVRPENLLHLQQPDHPNNPVIPRSNSLEGISSSSSSSNSSVSETARSAKKMSAASLARHKISTHESPEGANTFSDTSSENTQPSIVKEQFR